MQERAWGWWMSGSLASLFIHFPPLSVYASAEFALCLSAMAAILLGLYFQPIREANLRWLASGLFLFIGYSLMLNLPNLASNNWSDVWGPVAWLGHTVCLSLLLGAATACIVRGGLIDTRLLRNLLLILILTSLVMFKWPSYFAGILPYDHADNPLGLFYSTRIGAFYCVMGMALSGGRIFHNLIFLTGLVCCQSAVAWLAAAAVVAAQTNRLVLIISLIGALAVSCYQPYWLQIGEFAQLRLQNWLAALQVAASHPLGIGHEPLSYTAQMAHKGLLPNPASDWLLLTLRHGWLAAAAIGLSAWNLWKARELSPLWLSILAIAIFSSMQTSLSHSHNAMLAWFLLCAWLIQRSQHAART